MHEALEVAARQNLDLAAGRLRQNVAQAGVRIAGQIPNPTAIFSASRDVPHESLLLDQPFELGWKRSRRIGLARQQVALTNVEIDTLVRQVRRRVREAYYAAVLARRQTGQRAQALELTKRLRDIAKERFDAGDVPQLEVIQTELEVSRAEAEYEVARQRERVSYSQLSVLLNEPSETIWEPETPLEEMPSRVSLEELVGRAQSLNPDLQHLSQEQKVELSRKALLRAERIPNLDVQFGSDFNAPPDFRAGLRGGFMMGLPLFTRNQGELAQSSATLRLLDAETVATRRAVAGRVEAAYFEWGTRQTQVELYRNTLLPSARRLQALAEESYRAGRANILTVLDAQRNVLQVERDYLDSLSASQAAFAGLEETVGGPLD
ncbi:MAG TPA: TolC family protein [Candidatus Acidoferrales bacterium]|nr:TolC family protein [Candidatus Acidoferrales bacterium]